jgi:hypothetical protein
MRIGSFAIVAALVRSVDAGSEGAVLYALLAVAEGCHRRLVETDVLSLVPLDVGEPSPG